MTCDDAVLVVLQGDDHPDAAERRRALMHTNACPRCADILDGDDGRFDATIERTLARLRRSYPTPNSALPVLLGLVIVLQAMVALPWLFGANTLGFLPRTVSTDHLTRDGALALAVVIAGTTTIARPRHATAMLGLSVLVVGLQLVTAAFDEHHGRVSMGFELSHLLLGAIVVMILITARRSRRSFRRALQITLPGSR